MDFDTLLYILLIAGTVAVSFVKNMRKDEPQRQTKKGMARPITIEPDEGETVQPKTKKKRVMPQAETTTDNEYFSYETMSERDFEQAFVQNAATETAATTAQKTEQPHFSLSLDEEEVFKGVVWSEILKRKY